MDDFKKMEDFVEQVRGYVHVRVDEARLGAADGMAGVISSLIVFGVVAGVLFLAFVFVFISGALFVSYLLNDFMLGFLIVGVFLAFAGLCVWWGRRWMIRAPITHVILDELSKSKTEKPAHHHS